jgi:Tol biopolymer transport system component
MLHPGGPIVAKPLSRAQLAMTLIKDTALRNPNASPPVREVTDLILVTLGSRHDRVLSTGAEGPAVAWSPGGRRLAIARFTGRTTSDIFIVNANGSGSHRLTHTGDAASPVWSPDGRTIVFSRAGRPYYKVKDNAIAAYGATASIWSIRPDGRGLRRLTRSVTGQDDEPGSFSPSGRWLAFTRTEPVRYTGVTPTKRGVYVLANTSSVYLRDAENGKLRKLASQASHPSFSPDGRRLVLAGTRDHNGYYDTGDSEYFYAPDLYVVDLAGNRWRRLTHTRWVPEDFPSFSPNGTRIAYLDVSENRPGGVFEINTDGTCPTPLRKDHDRKLTSFSYTQPVWRPGSQPGPIRCRQG